MGAASGKSVFTGIVQNLLTNNISPANHEFWDELWKTVLPAEEIFELISADDVRRLINKRPENVKIIFTQAVAQLYQVVETPYPIYFDQALNCARILSRLLPFLIESKQKFVKELLWSRRYSKSEREAVDDKNTEENHHESEPLAVILVNTMFHLLFLPDFTVEDPNVEFNENDINTQEFKNALMWAPGVGSTEKTVVTSTQYDSNRIDILRLMISSCCDALYQGADSYDSCSSLWLEVATSVDAPYAEIVFYSLMNTVLGYDPVGWGLPYGNLVSTDTAKLVMESAIQTLLTLLDYGHPINYGSPPAGTSGESIQMLPSVSLDDTEARGFNVFRQLLGTIEAHDQLNFIYQGFVRLLNNAHQSESTYLPYSITRVGIEQELLILLWKCLEEMPKLMPYILKHCDITEILVPICYFMLEGRKDPSKVGLLYLCTFTLLKLSGERSFGVALNKPYLLQLPVDVPLFTGNHMDLLIIVLHKLIVSGLEKLSALYSCFLTIICNVSPYCKSMSTVAAVKLVNLLQLFVSPRFLYASEGNHVYVGIILETLNNIVQYQYEGNGNLIYAIIRRKELFEKLANLSLSTAIKNAQAVSNAKRSTQSPNTTSSPNTTASSAPNAQSKEKGKEDLKEKILGTKKESEEELEAELFAEGRPTDLISTKPVQRGVNTEGEVVDVKPPAASSNDEKKDIVPPAAPPVSASGNSSSPVGSSRFIPTAEWLRSVKAELPLNTIMRLLKNLVPQVEELAKKHHSIDEKIVTDFLHTTTMVGLLPVPHPIVIRKYQPNKFTCLWFTAFQWGVVFMHNQAPVSLFDGKNVKLFIVQNTEGNDG